MLQYINRLKMSLSLLANETVQHIMDYMPVTDCQSIRDAFKYTLRKDNLIRAYEDRVSVHRYFTNSGFDGHVITDILRRSNAYLISKRALEFFVPGSVDSHCEWTFFIPGSAKSIYHFAKSMESMKVYPVKWQTLPEMICERVLECEESMKISLDALRYAINQIDTTELSSFSIHALDELKNHIMMYDDTDEGSSILEIGFDQDNEIFVDHAFHEDDPSATNFITNMVKGTIESPGSPININISIGTGLDKGIQSVMTRHLLSAEQCFLSGFGAFHLYGHLACKKVSYRWEPTMFMIDETQLLSLRNVISGYIRSGFRIIYPEYAGNDYCMTRTIYDDQSIAVFDNISDMNEHLLWRLTLLKDMQWQERDLMISEIYTPLFISNYQINKEKAAAFDNEMMIPIDFKYMKLWIGM